MYPRQKQKTTPAVMPKTAPASVDLAAEIIQLQNEIELWELELKSQQDRLALNQRRAAPAEAPDSPAAIVKQAAERAKGNAAIETIQQTIADLQQGIQQRSGRLRQLQAEHDHIARQQAAAAAVEAIRVHVERIEAVAASLADELADLKRTWQEHHAAFTAAQSNPYAGLGDGYRWQPIKLVAFNFSSLPELVEQPSGGFVLQERPVNLFAVDQLLERTAKVEAQRKRLAEKAIADREARQVNWMYRIELLEAEQTKLMQQAASNPAIARSLELDIARCRREIAEYERLLNELVDDEGNAANSKQSGTIAASD